MAAQTIGVCLGIVLKGDVMARGGTSYDRSRRRWHERLAGIICRSDQQRRHADICWHGFAGQALALRRLHHACDSTSSHARFMRGCEILAQIHDHEHIIGYVEHGRARHHVSGDGLHGGARLEGALREHDPCCSKRGANLIDMASARASACGTDICTWISSGNVLVSATPACG